MSKETKVNCRQVAWDRVLYFVTAIIICLGLDAMVVLAVIWLAKKVLGG